MTSKSNTRRKSTRLLSSSRPALATNKSSGSLSSKAGRTLIRSHHTLHKKLRQAESNGDTVLADSLRTQIDKQGGLSKYQQASIQGQSAQRGGDSSKVLVEWIQDLLPGMKKDDFKDQKLHLLEVGALRTDNACSRCGFFKVERLDLNSQHEDILQQDFMQRPLPADPSEQFDVVSLSLVLNYVPDPVERGEMLKRVSLFLRGNLTNSLRQYGELLPGLFLVLPSPCVTNSRYLDEQRLEQILEALGYALMKKKVSPKLVYYYWRLSNIGIKSALSFTKKQLRSGGTRNNFAIVL